MQVVGRIALVFLTNVSVQLNLDYFYFLNMVKAGRWNFIKSYALQLIHL